MSEFEEFARGVVGDLSPRLMQAFRLFDTLGDCTVGFYRGVLIHLLDVSERHAEWFCYALEGMSLLLVDDGRVWPTEVGQAVLKVLAEGEREAQ